MDEAMTDLARRLVASPRWRWMGGVFWVAGDRCPDCDGAGGFRWREADGSENGERCPCAGRLPHYPGFTVGQDMTGALPDLTDPATVGCLRALVETRGRVMMPRFSGWWRLEQMTIRDDGAVFSPVTSFGADIGGDSLVEALVDALLHAPEASP